jgi:serine/threonine protein kinase
VINYLSELYEKLDCISEGTYGAVYGARDKLSNGIIALKQCFPHHEVIDGFPVTTLCETSLLRECCGCPYIVDLQEIAVSLNRSGIFLIFECYEQKLGGLTNAYYATHQKTPFRQEAQVNKYKILSRLS